MQTLLNPVTYSAEITPDKELNPVSLKLWAAIWSPVYDTKVLHPRADDGGNYLSGVARGSLAGARYATGYQLVQHPRRKLSAGAGLISVQRIHSGYAAMEFELKTYVHRPGFITITDHLHEFRGSHHMAIGETIFIPRHLLGLPEHSPIGPIVISADSLHGEILSKEMDRFFEPGAEGGDADRFNSVEAKVYQTADLLQKAEQTVAGNVSKISSNSQQIQTQQKQLNTVSQSVSENQRRIERNTASISENTVAIANVQTGIERVALDVSDLAHGLAVSNRQIDQNTAGIAIANALAGSTWLQSNESVAVSLNAGYYDGQSALALTGAARLHEKWSANFAISSDPSHGNIGARAGLRLGW